MAVQKYRYRRTLPIQQAKLRAIVGSTATITASGGETVIDVTIDDATEKLADLDSAMASLGWVNIATNPSDVPQDAVTASRSLYTTTGPTALVGGAIADGQAIVRSGATYVGQTLSSGALPNAFLPAAKLFSCLTADWAVNGNAPVSQDTANSSLLVRRFDQTIAEGAGFQLSVPASGATNLAIETSARAQSTPGGAVVAKLLYYRREITDGGAVGSWSSSVALTNVDLGTNLFYATDTTTNTLATWSLTAGKRYLIQIVRTSTGNTLVGDLTLQSIAWRFT